MQFLIIDSIDICHDLGLAAADWDNSYFHKQ